LGKPTLLVDEHAAQPAHRTASLLSQMMPPAKYSSLEC